DMARSEEDLNEIRRELSESGYIKKRTDRKKERFKSKPLHFVSSDGYHMYVGKNNIQNEELTFQFAEGGDWWFHAKQMPGSHVIVKCKGADLPDKTFEEAAALAAHYSKGADMDKVEVDYVQKKHVKKPAGSKPGFVVYYTNYSMVAETDISGIAKAEDE
ncbi:MAG: NFACT RNA binding domain-containing protein, partial [Lachnospiraceae bacterium]|nr:NFACT RNA binding domain-containing protein [Lachnospiraceae bacterium]